MTHGTALFRSWFAFVAAFALAVSMAGCGGGSSSELAPAKSAPGQPGAYYDKDLAASEAPMEEAAEASPVSADEAPPPAPPAPTPPSVFASPAVAQGGPPKAEAPRDAKETSPAPSPGPSPTPTAPTTGTTPTPGREPLLIYTATMTLAVFGTREAIGKVEELARATGGYLVSRSDASVTIRVPTKAFQGALDGVGKVGDELHREVNVRDVTEQFADLEIRLRNAEAVRQRLEALLAKAAKIEDALAVERELERVTQVIEQLKGKLRLFSELIAFSTITVNFQARPQDQVGTETRLPFDWLGGLGLPTLMNLEAP